MGTALNHSCFADDRYLLVDDTDEDASQLLTVICDGDPRSNRGFDFDAYRNGGNL
ncbi:MAG: hypothetical protein HOP09_06290 [Hyphomicrobium sp.]|jgi:hypothetical protein|nr:hypothetical protein [Hyphomicrobium sp.]